MASDRQLAANQDNAKLSTGPRTEKGKSRSRMNAWKHGLTAEKIVIRGEDAQQFEAIRQELWEQYQPAPGMESFARRAPSSSGVAHSTGSYVRSGIVERWQLSGIGH